MEQRKKINWRTVKWLCRPLSRRPHWVTRRKAEWVYFLIWEPDHLLDDWACMEYLAARAKLHGVEEFPGLGDEDFFKIKWVLKDMIQPAARSSDPEEFLCYGGLTLIYNQKVKGSQTQYRIEF